MNRQETLELASTCSQFGLTLDQTARIIQEKTGENCGSVRHHLAVFQRFGFFQFNGQRYPPDLNGYVEIAQNLASQGLIQQRVAEEISKKTNIPVLAIVSYLWTLKKFGFVEFTTLPAYRPKNKPKPYEPKRELRKPTKLIGRRLEKCAISVIPEFPKKENKSDASSPQPDDKLHIYKDKIADDLKSGKSIADIAYYISESANIGIALACTYVISVKESSNLKSILGLPSGTLEHNGLLSKMADEKIKAKKWKFSKRPQDKTPETQNLIDWEDLRRPIAIPKRDTQTKIAPISSAELYLPRKPKALDQPNQPGTTVAMPDLTKYGTPPPIRHSLNPNTFKPKY